jgi:hypothetical protein
MEIKYDKWPFHHNSAATSFQQTMRSNLATSAKKEKVFDPISDALAEAINPIIILCEEFL